MKTTPYQITPLSDDEKKEIAELVGLLKKKRRYSCKPDFWHLCIMRGCRHLLQKERRSV